MVSCSLDLILGAMGTVRGFKQEMTISDWHVRNLSRKDGLGEGGEARVKEAGGGRVAKLSK